MEAVVMFPQPQRMHEKAPVIEKRKGQGYVGDCEMIKNLTPLILTKESKRY